ncbi:centrosomal protein CEP57L1 [Lampris incognitus]|uniref:centrosomal protein CEP57L1 n=1 Tax=Lampris incognitus TaxID=2546036 RepID=UPI0024B6061F|nr:centrosomal protein CEP57L1 [Lampris incognitus]
METYQDQILDSPSKNSYIGSYYQPPDRMLSKPTEMEAPLIPMSTNLQNLSPRVSRTTPDVGSKAVIDALKTLQEKIRRLELERKQAEKNVLQFSQAAQKYERHTESATAHSQALHNPPQTDNPNRKELSSHLQSAEARCQVLEKQLDYMRKMVEQAEKDKDALTEKQALLQKQRLLSSSDVQAQHEKLEKLEKECVKLSETQTLAEMKIADLERKLLMEEHERKLVQEKADELQREMDINLRLSPPAAEEIKPKKTKGTSRKVTSSTQCEPASLSSLQSKQIPFVAGTSTSPSHSVHANVQSILHMMKHHQPQLCERVRSLHRSGCKAKRSLHRTLAASSTAPSERETWNGPAQSLDSLSDLLVALQDELGQMSFEHQELMRQIDVTHQQEHREDLERELEDLVMKMEEKGAQITKLRKHQQTVHKLTHNIQQKTSNKHKAKRVGGIRPPLPSSVRDKQQGRKGRAAPNNLQLLREAQKFRSSLKQDDISWET